MGQEASTGNVLPFADLLIEADASKGSRRSRLVEHQSSDRRIAFDRAEKTAKAEEIHNADLYP